VAFVTARPDTAPFRRKRSVTFAAGSLHGTSIAQTGVIGPRVTVPVSVPRDVAACAPAATARAAIRSMRTTRIGSSNGRRKERAGLAAGPLFSSVPDPPEGGNLLMRVDQWASAVRPPGP